MSCPVDDASDLTTDAQPVGCNVENLRLSSEDEEKKASPKPKARRKSSSSKPKERAIRPESVSNVQMNFVNATGIHIGNSFTYVATPQTMVPPDFVRSTSALKKNQEIKELLAMKESVTKEEIFWLSTHIGKNWRDVGTILGYTKGQLDQFEEDYIRRGVKQSIYEMLMDWKNSRREEEATVSALAKALWKAKEREAVQEWSKRKGKPVPPSSA